MVKVKNLEDGQDVYLVNVEEKSICCGSIVKKPHEATMFVSARKDIEVKVKDFDELIFTSVEEAEHYLFEKIDKGVLKSTEKDKGKISVGRSTEEDIENKDKIDSRSDIVLELEKDGCSDDVLLFVEKLTNKEIGHGIVIAVVFHDGDILYVPVFRNKKMGLPFYSYGLAFASIIGFDAACDSVKTLLNINI